MPQTTPTILLVDDYPDHLQIYGWMIEQAGYRAVSCLVRQSGPELCTGETIDLVLLDYSLGCETPTSDIARQIQRAWPGAPIVLLSDIHGLPAEMAPLVAGFVPKGEPARLVATIRELLARRPEPTP